MRFVIVLNRNSALIPQLNACGHLCVGLAESLGSSDLKLRTFSDANGLTAAVLTDYPLIVLSARSSAHMQEAHRLARETGIACNAFFSCMTAGEPAEQEAIIRDALPDDLEYVAIALFGDPGTLKPITRRFSLYRLGDSRPPIDDAACLGAAV